ncbi:hypothetical protein CRE_00957 [Caenorhabditis remanei]|uniref:Uncharacterized protein n=1 Tax=Caenorhabditis remanei TaxID=31234 RepID=E3MI19_CAERE|nr:hypothetical protein CRE_00957 [Caenorhabditis remanei]
MTRQNCTNSESANFRRAFISQQKEVETVEYKYTRLINEPTKVRVNVDLKAPDLYLLLRKATERLYDFKCCKVTEFSQILPAAMARDRAKTLVQRLKREIPRQHFEVTKKTIEFEDYDCAKVFLEPLNQFRSIEDETKNWNWVDAVNSLVQALTHKL